MWGTYIYLSDFSSTVGSQRIIETYTTVGATRDDKLVSDSGALARIDTSTRNLPCKVIERPLWG